jgi:hypothetical protein
MKKMHDNKVIVLSEKKEENVFAISANLNLAMTKFFID